MTDSVDEKIILTKNVINKVKELLAEENNLDLKLRAFIAGGGCSGFQYGFTFDEEQNDDDFVFQEDGITLLIDALSIAYLKGATIDYREDERGSEFIVKVNRNAKTTCGCGSSFGA